MLRRASLLMLLWLPVAPAPAEDRLVPEKTHAVIVGVLKWQDPAMGTFSAEKRKDQALFDMLLARGAKRENLTLLLDEQATAEAIRAALSKAAARVDKDEALIVYYAGHGMPAGGKIYFANYDVQPARAAETALAVEEIAGILKEKLRGGRVLLLADCCFSGALANAAKTLHEAGIDAASLTSATESIPSTSNWTFTHSMVDIIGGSRWADRDRSGGVTLAEAAAEVSDAMLFGDRQTSGYASFGVPETWILAPAQGDAVDLDDETYRAGQYVLTKEAGRPAARIVGRRGERLIVEIQQYNDRRQVTVDRSSLEPIDRETFLTTAAGDSGNPPAILPEEEALAKAACDERYSRLLRRIRVERDWAIYGEFHEFGRWTGTSWGGHSGLPAGYWVYVYPHWYIWSERKP